MAIIPIRNLLALIQKRFLKTAATISPTSPLTNNNITSSSTFILEFLTKSCGLPLESALSISQKVQFGEKNLQKPQFVLEFLKSHNFSNTHIAKLIQKRPIVLQCRIEDNLKPKFEFFIENGFVGQLLPELVVSNPAILSRALDSHLKPSFEILKSCLDSNEKVVAAIRRSTWLVMYDLKSTMQPNIDFLVKEGVPISIATKAIIWHPRSILQKHDRMVYAVNAVKNMGIEPKAPTFVRAVMVVLTMSESYWEKKKEVMKSVGWTEVEIVSVFKRYPLFFGCSVEKIRSLMDFYVNTMKLEPQTVVVYPKLLMYSIDKRIRPRYNVLKVLQSKNLIKGHKKIAWLLTIDEKKFLENYVNKYKDEVPVLLEIYGRTDKAKNLDA